MNSSLEVTALRPILVIGADVDAAAVEVGEEQGHAVGLACVDVLELGGAGQQQDLLGLQRLGDPHLAAVDDVVVAVALGERGDRVVSSPAPGSVTPKQTCRSPVDDAGQVCAP